MVGSGFRTKGVDRAIRAFAALDPAIRGERALVVVGEGKADAYRRLARRLGVGREVIFAGARPDVMLFDIGLPGMSGIEGIRRIKTALPQIEILVFSVFDDNEKVFNENCASAAEWQRRAGVFFHYRDRRPVGS